LIDRILRFALNFSIDGLAKRPQIVMPVPDQVRDDGSGIQKALNFLDSGACPGPDPGFAGMTLNGKE
jgi:hypothetical protein